jgi:hypothetical protein
MDVICVTSQEILCAALYICSSIADTCDIDFLLRFPTVCSTLNKHYAFFFRKADRFWCYVWNCGGCAMFLRLRYNQRLSCASLSSNELTIETWRCRKHTSEEAEQQKPLKQAEKKKYIAPYLDILTIPQSPKSMPPLGRVPTDHLNIATIDPRTGETLETPSAARPDALVVRTYGDLHSESTPHRVERLYLGIQVALGLRELKEMFRTLKQITALADCLAMVLSSRNTGNGIQLSHIASFDNETNLVEPQSFNDLRSQSDEVFHTEPYVSAPASAALNQNIPELQLDVLDHPGPLLRSIKHHPTSAFNVTRLVLVSQSCILEDLQMFPSLTHLAIPDLEADALLDPFAKIATLQRLVHFRSRQEDAHMYTHILSDRRYHFLQWPTGTDRGAMFVAHWEDGEDIWDIAESYTKDRSVEFFEYATSMTLLRR